MGEPVMKEPVKIVVGVTGGSGAVYALALLRQLRILECETHLVVSRMGAYVMEHECGVSLEELRTFADRFYEDDDLAAPGRFLQDTRHGGRALLDEDARLYCQRILGKPPHPGG